MLTLLQLVLQFLEPFHFFAGFWFSELLHCGAVHAVQSSDPLQQSEACLLCVLSICEISISISLSISIAPLLSYLIISD